MKHPPKELLCDIAKNYIKEEFQEKFIHYSLKKKFWKKLNFLISHRFSFLMNSSINSFSEKQINSNIFYWYFGGVWQYGKWEDFTLKMAYGGFLIFPEDASFLFAKEEYMV